MKEFSKMTKAELQDYLDFVLRQYRLVDGLWFRAVEDKYGFEVAFELNEEIWGKINAILAKEIKNRFHIKGRGISAVMEAWSYFPWSQLIKSEVEQTKDKAVLRILKCPMQEARLRQGRKEFPCKARESHGKEWSNFVKVIDERVKIRCLRAPPDPRPSNVWCEWEFSI